MQYKKQIKKQDMIQDVIYAVIDGRNCRFEWLAWDGLYHLNGKREECGYTVEEIEEEEMRSIEDDDFDEYDFYELYGERRCI